MAEKLTSESEPKKAKEAPPPLNSAARQALINEKYEERYNREKNIESLVKEHLEAPRKLLKKLKRDLKTNTQIDETDLELGYQVFKRKKDAGAMEDAHTDRIWGNMKDVFLALESGKTLDFLTVLAKDAA